MGGGEGRRIVDTFIEDAADALAQSLTFPERNELEVNLRFHIETQLVPDLLAVSALLLQTRADSLDRVFPEWIELIPMVLPSETAVLTEAGKGVDSGTHALLAENLDLPRINSWARRCFTITS